MSQGSIFVASIVGVALIMAIVVFCLSWTVFKQNATYRKTYDKYRRNLIESKMITPINKLLCSIVTLLLYLIFITLIFLFNKINVGLFLGAVLLSEGIGVGLFIIIHLFQREI